MACGMGMGKLAGDTTVFRRRNRWMLTLKGMVGEGLDVLMPLKGGRPDLEFKDILVEHVFEDVFIPGKPNWKPINLILYDTCPPKNNPVWNWILKIYRPKSGIFVPFMDCGFKRDATLELFNGCGDTIELWTLENAYPSQVNFGELDMSSSEVVTCDVQLKYDRAYRDGGMQTGRDGITTCRAV